MTGARPTHQRAGHAPQVRLTSLLDPARYPAAEIVALYHERWELELGYDELKTELLERQEALRSQSPDAVTQELWGVLLAYNLVRLRWHGPPTPRTSRRRGSASSARSASSSVRADCG